MLGAFTTCTVMCGSGARTGMTQTITPSRQRATRQALLAARTGSSAGAAGTASPSTVAPRAGAGIRRTFGTTTLASAQFWPVQSRRNRAQRGRRQQREGEAEPPAQQTTHRGATQASARQVFRSFPGSGAVPRRKIPLLWRGAP